MSTGGVITGFTFVPGAAATITSPTSMPLHLLALERAAKPADAGHAGDARLRPAIVNVAGYYLRLAETRTPAQMEALIWDKDSLNGADHGPACAAFASLTLELAAQAVGQQSWVTGGTTYPWPLHEWADVRVDPNPDSLGITSIAQDARAHDRWHPLGDGYVPQPGDWVLFEGHVEVVTSYANGVLDSIGADSLPNLTVNAHSISGPLAEQGVTGFVDNGHLASAQGTQEHRASQRTHGAPAGKPPSGGSASGGAHGAGNRGLGNIPGIAAPAAGAGAAAAGQASAASKAIAEVPGAAAPAGPAGSTQRDSGPAKGKRQSSPAAKPPAPYRKHDAPSSAGVPGTKAQQAFINQIAPGAMAAQQRFGVPAAVTIAQAIEESDWGHSELARQDHNLFGIKGTGPAGTVTLPTQEYVGGQWVTVNAGFRVYHNIAESIADHAELLATSGYYQRAMADRGVPDAFANDLTGIYATDPEYGANLIAIMRLYNLYRFDTTAAPQPQTPQVTPTPAASHPPAASPSPAAGHTLAGQAAIPGMAPAAAQAPHAAPAPSGILGSGNAAVPGIAVGKAYTAPGSLNAGGGAVPGDAAVPGVGGGMRGGPAPGTSSAFGSAAVRGHPAGPQRNHGPASTAVRGGSRIPGLVTPAAPRFQAQLPPAVATAFFATAKTPLARAEPLYRDVADQAGIPWEVLAACDWMQCQAHPRYSPVHGEKIGTLNADGSVYPTKSEALAQCANDLIELASAVYRTDLTAPVILSVRALADAFAAFRWGGLLKRHRVSAMEFPYSVAGLTPQHLKMHWPAINDPDAPDRPGGRFRMAFGAVPVVLSLNYPATV